MMRFVMKLIPVFMLISAMALVLGCKQEVVEQVKPRPVMAMQVGDIQAFGGRTFPGRAKPTEEVNMGFEVNGTLIERPVNIGDELKKGQLIAQVDPRDFQARLNTTQAVLKTTRANLNRARELIKNNFISQAELDKLEAEFETAESNVAVAKKALEDTTMSAPFEGKITELYVENFQPVRAKEKVARLVDISRIEMVVYIPENLISRVPEAEKILVTFDAYPDHIIHAKVKEIGFEASQTTRTFPVNLIMDQPESFTILPGMAGVARGDPEAVHAAIEGYLIPLTALFTGTNKKQSFVWVIDPATKKVSQREVTKGEIATKGVHITKGLTKGEWVVTAGVNSLEPGQEVILFDQQGNKQ